MIMKALYIKIVEIKATVETGKNIPLTHSPNGIKKHFLDIDKMREKQKPSVFI